MASGFTLYVENAKTGETEKVSGWNTDWILAILNALSPEQYDKVIEAVKAKQRKFPA